jgi:hypothetical protein
MCVLLSTHLSKSHDFKNLGGTRGNVHSNLEDMFFLRCVTCDVTHTSRRFLIISGTNTLLQS